MKEVDDVDYFKREQRSSITEHFNARGSWKGCESVLVAQRLPTGSNQKIWTCDSIATILNCSCGVFRRCASVSNQHRFTFHTHHPRCISHKYTCTHLWVCLKMRCGQAHCWHMSTLRQEKVFAPLINKHLVLG